MRALISGRPFRTVLGVLLSIAFFGATLRQVDVGAVASVLADAAPAWVAAAAILVVVEVALRAARWQLLLRPFRAVPFRYAAGYLCVGYFANTLLPARLGDLARAALAGRTLLIPRLATLGTIVVERLADGVTILVLTIGFGLVAAGAHTVVSSAILIVAAGLAAVAVLTGASLLARRLRLHETRRGSALLVLLSRVTVGATALRHPAGFLALIALTLLAFSVAVVAFWATSMAVGVSVTPIQAAVVMGGLALSTAVPAAPGSLGTYEFVGVAILTSYGVAPDIALATVLLMHAMALLLPALAGLGTAWLVHFNVGEVVSGPAPDRSTVSTA